MSNTRDYDGLYEFRQAHADYLARKAEEEALEKRRQEWLERIEIDGREREESARKKYGVVTKEGLAGECDECGEWWNPLEQISMNERDWFLCRVCMTRFLLGR